jgi:hypothetical protein
VAGGPRGCACGAGLRAVAPEDVGEFDHGSPPAALRGRP